MRKHLRTLIGPLCIVLISAVIGFGSNALRSDGLPLIRKPLRETRSFASREQLLQDTESSAVSRDKAPIEQVKSDFKDKSETADQIKPKIESSDRKVNVSTNPKAISSNLPKETVPAPSVSEAKPVEDKKTAQKVEALFTTLEDAKGLYDKKLALFVDSRPIEDYEAEHISGAVSLYCEQLDELYEQVLGAVPKDRVIVTFCSDPECAEAIKLADALVARGHTKVVILLEGLPGWKDAGYPTATGKEPG